LTNIIEKEIKSVETLTDIYLYLSSNYKDLTKVVIDNLTSFFTKNKDNLKGKVFYFYSKK